MKIERQTELRKVLSPVALPKMAVIEQHFPDDAIQDVPACLWERLMPEHIRSRIQPGMKVVLTGSSRQIHDMPVVLRELSSFVKAQGAQPYIIPAMGSHAGGIAEKQKELLEGYGITEAFCGCPIYSSMETVQVGALDNGDEVRVDRFAHAADAVIVVGRIKAHTSFSGPYESGLVKMMAIGMGKREGADSLHRSGFGAMAVRMPQYARQVFDSCRIAFGVAIIENEKDLTCRLDVIPAYDETYLIKGLSPEEIISEEPKLKEISYKTIAHLLFDKCDVLVVDKIGKNISGAGMDPNITGTFSTPFVTGGLKKQRTVVLDIAEESHGAFVGLGFSDVTTNRVFEKLRTNATYLNLLTATTIQSARIPMIMEDDKLALQTAIKTLVGVDKSSVRMALIKNTLSMERIMVSGELLREIRGAEGITVLEEPRELRFDEENALLELTE